MASRRHTVGIIGLGFGRAHVPAFQTSGCTVVALCQRDREAAQAVATRYGIPRVFERWEELLSEAQPEIVVVAAPPHLHHKIVVEALGRGAHVLCEKPLAMDAAEARSMADAAARAGRVAMTNFNWRFPAAMQRFHAMAAGGYLGRVFHVGARWLGGRLADETLPHSWRMERAQAGHGAMGDMGVHVIDLIRWTFGEFATVCAHSGIAHATRTAPGGAKAADADDFCTVLAELESGAHVTMTISRVARGASETTLEAYGASGALSYRMGRKGRRWYRGELAAAGTTGALEPVRVATGLPRSAGEGDQMEVTGKATIGPLIKRFLAAIKTGASPSPSFEDGARAQAVLDAVLESSARRDWVRVDAGARPGQG
jgi:predicted dehydrogenase